MIKFLLLTLSLLVNQAFASVDHTDAVFKKSLTAQSISTPLLGVGTSSVNASALLEMSSTTKGFLPPRMTEAQRDLILLPATGLTVFNTTAAKLNVYDGSDWVDVGSGSIFVDTLANIVGLPNVEGAIAYATDLDQLVTNDGTKNNLVPKNEGEIDYLSLGHAKNGNPFTGYADASATPVDGNGGSPTATLTINSQKFRFTSGTLGDGFAYAFTIDPYDKATIWTLELGSEHVSGTYTKGDLTVWLYDVTNSQLIAAQPVGDVDNFTGFQDFRFQLGAGTSYRFLIHQKTSATFVRDFRVSLKKKSFSGYAAIQTDWKNYGPISITGTTSDPVKGTVTVDEFWARRNGSDLEYFYKFRQTSAGGIGSGDYLFELPPVLGKFDIAKTGTNTVIGTNGSTDPGVFGYGGAGLFAIDSGSGWMAVYSDNKFRLMFSATSGPTYPVGSTWYGLNGTNVMYTIQGKVPMLGWSAETKSASEYDGRVVSAVYYYQGGVGGVNVSANTPINYDTKDIDTHNAVTTGVGTWKFTAPVAGVYNVEFTTSGSNTSAIMSIWKNGSYYRTINYFSGSSAIKLNVGDYIDIRSDQTEIVYGMGHSTPSGTQIAITLSSGAQQITVANATGLPVGSATLSAASSATISNLNCNIDKKWKIKLKGEFSGSSSSRIGIRPNGDTTTGNYQGQHYEYYGTGGTANTAWSSLDHAMLADKIWAGNEVKDMDIEFHCDTTGLARPISSKTAFVNSSQPDGGFHNAGGGWLDTTNNVTSLVFYFGGLTFTGTINIYQDKQ